MTSGRPSVKHTEVIPFARSPRGSCYNPTWTNLNLARRRRQRRYEATRRSTIGGCCDGSCRCKVPRSSWADSGVGLTSSSMGVIHGGSRGVLRCLRRRALVVAVTCAMQAHRTHPRPWMGSGTTWTVRLCLCAGGGFSAYSLGNTESVWDKPALQRYILCAAQHPAAGLRDKPPKYDPPAICLV